MSMQPIQRFPNGIISPSKLSCYDKAVEMPGPCKAWNGESVPPFTPPLGRRRWSWRLPHYPPPRRFRLEVNNYKHLYVYKYE
jgi:hypothetical protein